MTNQEKDELRRFVRWDIKVGRNCKETIAHLKSLGYSATTIRHYFKALSSLGEVE